MDQPTEEERLNFLPVDAEGRRRRADQDRESITFKDAATTVAEMTPIIGDAMAAKEIYDELQKEDPDYRFIAVLGGAGLIGAIPGIGDVAAKGIRNAADMIKRIEVDPDALGSLGGNVRLKPKEQSVWSYPEQLYDSADTSINVSKKPAGYNELKKRGEIKDGDVIVDIGGGRFDNLVEDAAEEGATVKVYDPFNRTPEHNAAVVDSVKDGQADMAMSHNVLNVIQEDKNIIDIAVQAENAIKPNGKAHFSVYEGDGKGVGKVTTKGYQRNEKTQAYVPLIEQVFGKGNVTKKGKIITATKSVKGFSEGGMALEEQMAMNFGDVPDNTIGQDPVSGNDIPMGSTAENVRDDIPTMLSEGEIVVPADVVNFHGVKLFEDLRAEAKMGYAQMANDGRIGGEPMNDAEEDRMMDIELSELDLEVMDDEQPEAPVRMDRGGMNVERGRGSIYKSYSAPKKSKPTRDRSMSAVVKRAQANKGKPKNRFEAIRERLKEVFGDDDRRPTLTKKPSKSDPIRPSIAQQINFGGDYKDKEPLKPEPKKKRSSVRGAGDVTQAYRGEDEPLNVRYYDQPFYKRLMEGLGVEIEDFDEGGLIGGEDQFNQPFYAEGQEGGFDMENAYANYGEGPLLEMREYMNDAGHRIFITFIDGVPQMEIPAGYYPVEEGSTVVAPEVPPIGGSGGSDSGGSGGGGMDIPAPTPINYKELTMEELSQMVEDQKSMKGNALAVGIGSLNAIVGGAMKVAMWNETRQLKREIERRRDDPATSEVDKRRYDQLLEIANAEEPGLIATLLGKLTGNDPNAPETGGLDYDQLDKMTKAYTPEDQQADLRNNRGFTPGVDGAITPAQPAARTTPITSREPSPSYDPIPSAESGFGGMGRDPAEEFGGSQTRFEPSSVDSTPAPRTATKPIRQESDRVRKARQNTQKVMKDMRDRGASREERTKSLKAAARTENVLRDLDRGVVRGFEKGGLVDKPAVKKVVKGLKKASKSHAKQADQLEKAMKKKSK